MKDIARFILGTLVGIYGIYIMPLPNNLTYMQGFHFVLGVILILLGNQFI